MIQIDPQAFGWYDDGSESGAIRSRVVRGDVVPAMMRTIDWRIESSGTVTALFAGGINPNPDGSGSGLSTSITAGLNNGLRVWGYFRGRIFGIRWRRLSNTGTFSIVIDGVAYEPPGTAEDLMTIEGQSAIEDHKASWIVADNLTDGLHHVEIVMVSNASAANAVFFYGVLLDRLAGYMPEQAVSILSSTVTLTTSQGEIPTRRGQNDQLRGIAKIIYTNVTASPVIVTVQSGATVVWARSIPANDVVELNFTPPLSPLSTYTHAAASGSAINATIVGVI